MCSRTKPKGWVPPIGAAIREPPKLILRFGEPLTVVWSQAIVSFKLDLLPTLCRKHRRKQYPIVFFLVSQHSEPKKADPVSAFLFILCGGYRLYYFQVVFAWEFWIGIIQIIRVPICHRRNVILQWQITPLASPA